MITINAFETITRVFDIPNGYIPISVSFIRSTQQPEGNSFLLSINKEWNYNTNKPLVVINIFNWYNTAGKINGEAAVLYIKDNS